MRRRISTIAFVSISFSLTADNINNTEILIYNIRGQLVDKLEIKNLKSGNNEVVWNGNNKSKQSVASGLYFYKLVSDGKTIDTKKMLLIK